LAVPVIERVRNVGGRDVVGVERFGVEIDHDLALLAAVGRRDGGTLDGGELGADEVRAEIV